MLLLERLKVYFYIMVMTFYDITPLDTAITGGTLTTVNGSRTVTINKGSHGLEVGRYVTLSSVTVTGASDFTAAELEQPL